MFLLLLTSALTQILVTNVANETSETPDWAPEIPFESLARSEVSEVDVLPHSLDEELNNLMDISIEIESNKVMKADYIDSWTVSLRDREMMAEYSRQTDQTYRSSIFSLTVLWILVFVRQGNITENTRKISSHKRKKYLLHIIHLQFDIL